MSKVKSENFRSVKSGTNEWDQTITERDKRTARHYKMVAQKSPEV